MYDGRDYSFDCHHDHFNERIRIDDYTGNLDGITSHIQSLFTSEYSKCILKVKEGDVSAFLSIGFTYEGKIRNYFSGIDAHLMTKYRENWRRNSTSWTDEDLILEEVLKKSSSQLKQKPMVRQAEESDAEALALLYKKVFAVYPTPMDDPEYIQKAMKDDTIFFVLEEDGLMISAASAEVNRKYKNAEMTDCATLSEFRKGGTMRHLIMELEKKLVEENIYYAYSIARSLSFGMNAVFHQLSYEYGGRLVNNVKIYHDWENMNLWSKMLTFRAE
ncbi:MAG: putative beta-lysine N-acetyltransferase [Anaerobacillus sp.]